MNQIFKFRILHLKGLCRLEDFHFASCSDSASKLLILSQASGRIPQTMNASQPNFSTRTIRPRFCFKRSLKLCKAACESDSPLFLEKSRNRGGVSFARDASPHSPWIIFRSRKPVVGAGLLVHLSAPIAGLFKTHFFQQNQSQNKQNPRLQSLEVFTGLFMFAVLALGASFQKNFFPGTMSVLGTLGGSL